jgi:hypothetical protein
MEQLLEFAKILVPAGLVLYAMFLMVKSFLNKELEKKMLEIRGKSIEAVLPNRLQAYERMCLFLERISPNSLILRLNIGEFTSQEFQHIILNEIREEYNHNVSQQVYMSNEVWELIKSAKEELVTIVNDSAERVGKEATSIDLSKQILEIVHSRPDNIAHALIEVKNEISQVF